MDIFKFQNDTPILNYCQKFLNSCCFIILASSFDIFEQTKSSNDISLRIEESLKSEVGNCIYFADAILKKRRKIKGEPRFYYSLKKYKNKGSYDIMIDINENVTLVQLMDYLGNVNHAISVVGYWIFD